jgi:hypothetical protein
MAGLSALPLTASAAAPAAAPNGSASAAALQLTISLQPLKSIVNTAGGLAGGAFSWQTVTNELSQLQSVLCGSPLGCQPLGLTIPKDLPDSLTVRVAQANDNATLNSLASDIVAGHSDSTPVATNWEVLNANLGALQTLVTSFINQGTSALTSALQTGNVNALSGFLSAGLSGNGLSLSAPVLGTASLNLLGTVQANLPLKNATDKVFDTANAVSITGIGTGLVDPSKTGLVTVDPFSACAASANLATQCHVDSAQVGAQNSLVAVKLPDLLGTSVDAGNLKAAAGTLQQLVDALSKAIADPSNAGSILTTVSSSLPSALQGPVSQLGGVLNSTVSQVTGTVSTSTPIDLSALKLWDTKLAAALDSLNGVIDALAKLQLPDITNLVTSKEDIATAKTVPVLGGGVASTATSTLGSLSVLPIGAALTNLVNTAITTAGLPLSQVSATTPLLSIDGITSSAQAAVGAGSSSPTGSAGLRTISVLGQTIDLDNATKGLALGPGQEWNIPVTIPALGSVTLDITRGVPQIVADTPTYREVHMAALDVRLINGLVGCSSSSCSNPLSGVTGLTGAVGALNVAGAGSNGSGIAALGSNGSTILEVAAPMAQAMAAMDIVPVSCTVNCGNPGSNQASLVSTGMLGGNALPAGLLLVAVAISLRLLPNLRLKLRRVR